MKTFHVEMRESTVYVDSCRFPHVRLKGRRQWIEITEQFYALLQGAPGVGDVVEVDTQKLKGAQRYAVSWRRHADPDEFDFADVGRDGAGVCVPGLIKFFGRVPKALYIRKAVSGKDRK